LGNRLWLFQGPGLWIFYHFCNNFQCRDPRLNKNFALEEPVGCGTPIREARFMLTSAAANGVWLCWNFSLNKLFFLKGTIQISKVAYWFWSGCSTACHNENYILAPDVWVHEDEPTNFEIAWRSFKFRGKGFFEGVGMRY
jgi:hypothetical protein